MKIRTIKKAAVELLKENIGSSVVFAAIMAVVMAISTYFFKGYSAFVAFALNFFASMYFLNLITDKDKGIGGTILDGLEKSFKVVATYVIAYLIQVIYVVIAVVAVLFLVKGLGPLDLEAEVYAGIIMFAGFLATLFVLNRVYSLALLNYVMIDDDIYFFKAIKRSINMIKGYKFKFFRFQASFVISIFITIATLGVASIITLPYIFIATSLYYMVIKDEYVEGRPVFENVEEPKVEKVKKEKTKKEKEVKEKINYDYNPSFVPNNDPKYYEEMFGDYSYMVDLELLERYTPRKVEEFLASDFII